MKDIHIDKKDDFTGRVMELIGRQYNKMTDNFFSLRSHPVLSATIFLLLLLFLLLLFVVVVVVVVVIVVVVVFVFSANFLFSSKNEMLTKKLIAQHF